MSDLCFFDTSVLIDNLRYGRHEERIQSVTGRLRACAVVLSELWRGATTLMERKFLWAVVKNQPVLTPTEKNWLESGQLLGVIRAEKGYPPEKLRDLHFDVLIALTARSHGARVITSNRADFELIASYRKFQVEFW